MRNKILAFLMVTLLQVIPGYAQNRSLTINQSYPTSIVEIAIFLIIAVVIILLLRNNQKLKNEARKLKEELKSIQNQEFTVKLPIIDQEPSKSAIGDLEDEKIKIEKIHRDKELANQTMDLILKNKFLVKITEELDKVNRSSSDPLVNQKLDSLIQKINKEIDNEKQWEVFETAFDHVHEDFLKRLKQKYPTLTPKELKLCAYLRLNISTKELAPLMNISIRGVEICRYRVRKKLEINRDESLTKMIMDL